ncbi:MAG: hypothetical protein M0C28_37345 [Candidatus Moduliflexus flocculans]|nr:hypothetical protein [Candidatus Moduliflexus flocculans]
MTATLQGFQTLVAGNINLITGQAADLKLTMQPGGLETTVEVSGATPVVQTSSSTVQTSMTVRQVQELPLNGRNPLQLVALTAGASITAPGASVAGQQDNQAISVNGLRTTQNNFRMDGSNYNNRFFGSAPVLPNPDTLEEFTVQSANYSARTAGAGALVELSTRSGSNQLHFSAFEFLRDTSMNANDPFNNAAGREKPPFKLNQFGGTIGGKIVENKTFYFGAYQATRRRSAPGTASVRSLTADERAGNFSTYTGTIIDPTTGLAVPWQHRSREPARSDRAADPHRHAAAAEQRPEPGDPAPERHRRRSGDGTGRSPVRAEQPAHRPVLLRRQPLPAHVQRAPGVPGRQRLPQPELPGPGLAHLQLQLPADAAGQLLQVPADPGTGDAEHEDDPGARREGAPEHHDGLLPRRAVHGRSAVQPVLGRRPRADAVDVRLPRHGGLEQGAAQPAVRRRHAVRPPLRPGRVVHRGHLDVQRLADRLPAGRHHDGPAVELRAGLGPDHRPHRVEEPLLGPGRLEGQRPPDGERRAALGALDAADGFAQQPGRLRQGAAVDRGAGRAARHGVPRRYRHSRSRCSRATTACSPRASARRMTCSATARRSCAAATASSTSTPR